MVSFNTVNGKDCCNKQQYFYVPLQLLVRFNTVNGKDCCNEIVKSCADELAQSVSIP